MNKLSDVGAERAVLAGIFRFGLEAYSDVSDVIDSSTFTVPSNQIIYQCAEHAIKNNPKLDIPVFLSATHDMGVAEQFKEKTEIEYLRSLTNFPIEFDNIRGQAKKIKKLEIARIYQHKLKEAYNDLNKLTGNEGIDEIIAKAEKPIFDFAKQFKNGDERPQLIGENIEEYVEFLRNNPNRKMGIPSPWDKYNDVIGGGFRRKTVALFGARPGVGKALRNDELVYTPSGPKHIDKINIGDTVCTPNGRTSKVTGVFPQGKRKMYRVFFEFGSSIYCSAEHLWSVTVGTTNEKKVVDTKTLKELIKTTRYYITNTPCYYDNQSVDVLEPYQFVEEIPDVYKYNSINVRVDCVKKILKDRVSIKSYDYYAEDGELRIYFTSTTLALDMQEIFSSLGYNTENVGKILTITGNNVGNFLLNFNDYNTTVSQREIVFVDTDLESECTCISIEDKNGLFLTTNHIVTHNSTLADNIAIHSAHRCNIPILMLDTEMGTEDHHDRLLAYFAKVNVNDVSRGRFSSDKYKNEKISKAANIIKKMPYTYKNISGKKFEEILSIVRRWIYQTVGFDENGRTKDCLVIYDYFKLMDTDQLGDMQEYQAIGFQISDMHNFCVEYDVPVVAFVQLNRDGIDKELTSSISQSDRLVWLSTVVAIFKAKSQEEIANDGEENGNRKLIPIKARHGAGMEEGNFINMNMQGQYAMIEEMRFNSDVQITGGNTESGFEWTNNLNELLPNTEDKRTDGTGNKSNIEFPSD